MSFIWFLLFCSRYNFAEKCDCPKTIHANWYSIPPYIRDKGSYKPGGLFPLLLEKIVARCCGNCTGGDGESEISYVNRRDNLVTKARDKIYHWLRFSNDCRKIATKVTYAMIKRSKQNDKPIGIPSKYLQLDQSARKIARTRCDCVWFASHWLKNWRESIKPISKHNNLNRVITFFKTALWLANE